MGVWTDERTVERVEVWTEETSVEGRREDRVEV